MEVSHKCNPEVENSKKITGHGRVRVVNLGEKLHIEHYDEKGRHHLRQHQSAPPKRKSWLRLCVKNI